MPKNPEPLQVITVSGLPKALLAEIDAIASEEQRNRSNLIVKTLADAVRERKQQKQGKKAA